MASSLQGHSNLRSDPGLSQRRIEALITQQGIPTIKVQQGDLITRQGDTISPQAFDVLDYFGLVNRRPRPLAWLGHFLEALAMAGVLVLVLRRGRACREPRQALLALGFPLSQVLVEARAVLHQHHGPQRSAVLSLRLITSDSRIRLSKIPRRVARRLEKLD